MYYFSLSLSRSLSLSLSLHLSFCRATWLISMVKFSAMLTSTLTSRIQSTLDHCKYWGQDLLRLNLTSDQIASTSG